MGAPQNAPTRQGPWLFIRSNRVCSSHTCCQALAQMPHLCAGYVQQHESASAIRDASRLQQRAHEADAWRTVAGAAIKTEMKEHDRQHIVCANALRRGRVQVGHRGCQTLLQLGGLQSARPGV